MSSRRGRKHANNTGAKLSARVGVRSNTGSLRSVSESGSAQRHNNENGGSQASAGAGGGLDKRAGSMPARSSRGGQTAVSAAFNPNSHCKYLLFFKPFGVLSQFTIPDGSTKATLSEFGFPSQVYPVGRLDFDSEGLLVLTDDARMNNALLNPNSRHARTYLAQVEHVPTQESLNKLHTGVILDGRKTLPAKAELFNGEPALPPRPVPIRYRKNIPTAWIKLSLHEGRNRQVRRMTAACGYPTLRLVRISIGRLNLFSVSLKPGEWISLSKEQILQLFEQPE